MNKKSFFALSLSAALFASCGSDDVVNPADGGDLNGDAYVSIQLHLPSVRATRATDNFDPGTGDEWKVNDVTAIFFDQNRRFVDSKSLSAEGFGENTNTSGITADKKFPTQRVDPRVKYVLVLLNANGSGVDVAGLQSGTFEAFNSVIANKTVSDFTGAGNNDFFMSNSPKSTSSQVEGLGDVLVEITPQRTQKLAEEAGNIAQVYVERAVGKVSVDKPDVQGNWTAGWTYTIPENNNDIAIIRRGDQIEFTDWALDVTNTKMYPVRNFKTVWASDTYRDGQINRFLSNKTVDETFGFRTNWTEDPNYDDFQVALQNGTNNVDRSSDANKAQFNYLITDTDFDNNKKSVSEVNYCFENTFATNHMKQGETTRIVFRATYTPKGFTKNVTWYLIGNSNTPYSADGLKAAIKAATNAEDVEVPAASGITNMEDIKVKGQSEANFRAMNEAEKNAALSALGATVTTYLNGKCYYVARIKHFGDDDTKWDGTTDYTTSTSVAFDKAYLGRYGIVRNNWYQLSLNTVSAPGSPTIPEIPNTMDDEQNYYLQTTVHIMDWAVRTQPLDF